MELPPLLPLADKETEWDSLVSLKLLAHNTRLVEARNAKGLSQKQAAPLMGLSIHKLSQIENLRLVPSPVDADKITAHLEKPPGYLFPDILMRAIEEGVFRRRDAQLTEPEIITLAEAQRLRLSYDGETQMIEEIERKLLKEQIDTVLDTLDPREKQVLEMRFGLVDGKSRALEEIGLEIPRVCPLRVGHIGKEQVRQIEAKALRKLRGPSRARLLRDYWRMLA